TEGWEERGVAGRWLRMLAYSQLWNWRMRGYQSVLANSIFTSNWIARYWRSSSEVLYPPVAIKSDAVPKSNTIVSLGRFIAHDSKNHALQLKAFREFLSSHGGDWHLCLIGFCTNLPEDLAYLEKLREEAKEMPVTFLANASRDNLWNRLADAKLYWHVTALGEGDGHHPERMEHFGISTVEAMGAGCIPLVPRSGGQPEIVRHGIDGFLCDDLQSLVQYTSHLADDESLFQQMSRSAQARSKIFRPEKFSQRLIELVADALSHEGGKPLSVHETSTASLVHPR
ncbi:MAG TPA: glycosyltransferase, partial [Nitrospira sp.]|nr:glycosyltransferase [Nitrospira sp.]